MKTINISWLPFFRRIRQKSEHTPATETRATISPSPVGSGTSNITVLASSEAGIDITRPMAYYLEVPGASKIFVFNIRSQRIYDREAAKKAVRPQGESSSGFEEERNYNVDEIYASIMNEPQAADVASVNSTKEPRKDEDLEQRITSLFIMSGEEEFENGMVSDFSRNLCSIIESHGNAAMEIISYLFLYKNLNPEVMSEALRWLGRIEQVESHSYRLWLLEKSLESPSIFVRDGAILGIASLDDTWARSAVNKAIEKENCEELRENMQTVLEQLEETAKCL